MQKIMVILTILICPTTYPTTTAPVLYTIIHRGSVGARTSFSEEINSCLKSAPSPADPEEELNLVQAMQDALIAAEMTNLHKQRLQIATAAKESKPQDK
jgi:hypothetical protein